MSKLFYILPNKTGEIREKLCIEDIRIPQFNTAVEFGLIEIQKVNGEKVLWFKEPIRVPKFNKFYASKLKSVGDPYLPQIIRRLLYLNPGLNAFGVKKLTEKVVMRFSAFVPVESKVLTDSVTFVPVLKFEEVEPVVKAIIADKQKYEPDNEIPVLFKRDSVLSREDKISCVAQYRSDMVKEKLESVIHTVAEHLIDTQTYLKITNQRIQDTKMVRTRRGPASVKTISKYLAPRTKRIIDEHNDAAFFSTEKSQSNYLKFLTLDPDLTVEEKAETLNVSKSTIIEFRRILNKVTY